MKLGSTQKNIIVIEIIFLLIGIILLFGVGGKKARPITTTEFDDVSASVNEFETTITKFKTDYSSKFAQILLTTKTAELEQLKLELNPELEEIKLIEIKGKIENLNIELNNYTAKLKQAEENEKKFKEAEKNLNEFKEKNKNDIKKFKNIEKSISEIEKNITEIEQILSSINSIDDYSKYDDISNKNYKIQVLFEETTRNFDSQLTAYKKDLEAKKKAEEIAKNQPKETIEKSYDTPDNFESYVPPPPKVEKKIVKEKKPEILKSPTPEQINYPSKFKGGKGCMIEVTIDKTGKVSATKVYLSSGNTEFDDFCQATAGKLYLFKPAEVEYSDGSSEKVESSSIIPFQPPAK